MPRGTSANTWGEFRFSSRRLTAALQDTENPATHVSILGRSATDLALVYLLVAGDVLDLGDAVRVTENDTNLGGGRALLGELALQS